MAKKLKEVKDHEENEIVHLKEGDVLDGILTKKAESKENKTPMYHFGKKLLFGGKGILDKKMTNVKVGERVQITRCEDATSEKTGRTYQQFLVRHEVDEDEDAPAPAESREDETRVVPPEDQLLDCKALDENDQGKFRCLNMRELPCLKNGQVCPEYCPIP